MIVKLLNKLMILLKESFHIIFGILLISGLFYLRLIPRISRDLWENMTQYQIFSTSLSIIIISVNIYLFLKILGILPTFPKAINFTPMRYIANLLLDLLQYLLWVLQNLYLFLWYISEKIIQKTVGYEKLHYNTLRKLAQLILKANKNYIFWFLMGIKLVPRVFFVIAFAYDVLYCQQLHYTFKCIPCLLLPLIEIFLIFVFENFYELHWEGINSFVLEEKTENSNKVAYFFIPEYQYNPPHFVANFSDFFINHFSVLIDIASLIFAYQTWKHHVFPYYKISLVLCCIRLFLLFFILFYGLS